MPEVSDPTHISEYDVVIIKYEVQRSILLYSVKEYVTESVVLSDVGGSCRRWSR